MKTIFYNLFFNIAMHICNNQIQIKMHMDIVILLSLSKIINSKIELKKNFYLYTNTIFFSLIKKNEI